ncbi:MAG TPA: GspH/FimT family pseudopilin [Burkholderiales bacterium]|nr:GspH/FimT family pseudopilin [Burkholderiales bacterium]
MVGRPSAAAGFTITELMIVVVVMSVLASFALPAYNDFVKNQRIKNASFDLFSTLVLARSEAVTRNTSVTVTPATGGWANGWTVAVGGTTLRSQPAIANITIAQSGGNAAITYNGTGRVTSPSTTTTLQLSATGANSIQTRCITIDLSGRPVSKASTC